MLVALAIIAVLLLLQRRGKVRLELQLGQAAHQGQGVSPA